MGEREQPQRGLGRGGPAEQGPGTEREQQLPRGRVVEPRDRGAEQPGSRSPGRQEQRAPVRLVIALRVAGMRGQCHGVAEQHPRFQARQGDSRKPHRTHAGGGLAVDAQALDVVAGRERQFGPADKARWHPRRTYVETSPTSSIRLSSSFASASLPSAIAHSASSDRSWISSSLAPSRRITGRAALACPTATARSPTCMVSWASIVCGIAAAQGPSSSVDSASARVAAVIAPTGSPAFSAQDAQPLAGGQRGRPVLRCRRAARAWT